MHVVPTWRKFVAKIKLTVQNLKYDLDLTYYSSGILGKNNLLFLKPSITLNVNGIYNDISLTL